MGNEIIFEIANRQCRLEDILKQIDIIKEKYPNAKIHVKVD